MLDELRRCITSDQIANVRSVWQIIHHVSTDVVALRVWLRRADEWADSKSSAEHAKDSALQALQRIEDNLTEVRPDAAEELGIARQRMLELLDKTEKSIQAALAAAYDKGKSSADPTYELHSPNDEAVRRQVWEITDGTCIYCEAELIPNGRGEGSFVVEHVVPRAHGGPDNLANYVPACKTCNMVKKSDHVVEFIRKRLPRRKAQQQAMLRLVEGDKSAAGGNDQ